MSEQGLVHGWEPHTPYDDSLLRGFVLAMAERLAFLAEASGGVVERADDAIIACARSMIVFDNGVVLLKPPPLIDLDAILDRADALVPRDQPYLVVSAWHLPDLTSRGLKLMGHPPFMFRPAGGLVTPPPPELEIREVRDASDLAVFLRALGDGYPMPGAEGSSIADPRVLGGPVRLYTGFVDGRPVATSGAYVGHGVNDVEWVSTMPDARRHGYGEALTWTATTVDPSLPAVLIASDDGQSVYERMGYLRLLRTTLWWRMPAPVL
jgi:hypothetical protein